MFETSGVLRPAIERYLNGQPLTGANIAAIRAYFRQWMAHPGWQGPAVNALRVDVERLDGEEAIRRWLDAAEAEGIDPL